MRCARCQAENPGDTSFCGHCGARLEPKPGSASLPDVTRTISLKTPSPGAGRIINGKYKILGELGRGGMGLVYKAEDLQLKRLVAVKFLSAELVGEAEHRSRFLREARMASALSHPHICVIHEIGEEDGRPFIAMEHVAGRSLKDVLAAGPMAGADVVRYGLEIASALEHAHGKGIVHRDLKSSNVMITPGAGIKILDFGLAKRLEEAGPGESIQARSSITEAGTFVGTMHYAAPEIFRGEQADARTDLWSLGVMLYEMAAGKLPFDAPTGFELCTVVSRDAPAPLPPSIPGPLRTVIGRCLEKDKDKRYQSAAEVKAPLEQLVSQVGASLILKKTRSWRLLKYALATAAALVLIGLGIGILTIVRDGRKAGPPAGTTLSMGGRPSSIPEANEYYERGMLFLAHQFDLPRARAQLEKAIALDPAFAEARAWFGFTFLLEVDSGFSNDSGFLYKAEEELRRALESDPSSARAHSALGGVYLFLGRKDQMRQEFEKARKVAPGDIDLANWVANSYLLDGDYAVARKIFSSALERDSLFFPARMNIAEIHRLEGNPANEVSELEKILEQDPQNIFAPWKIARAFFHLNDLPRARARLEGIPKSGPKNYSVRISWALLLALEGKTAEARSAMDEDCLKYAALTPFETLAAAEFYAVLGDAQNALDWLEKAVRNGDQRIEWFKRDRLLASIRGLPRFKQIEDSIAFGRVRPPK